MSMYSRSISVPPVQDPEKGAAGLKMKTAAAAGAEHVAVVDARKALLIKRGLDVFFVVYVLFSVAAVALMVKVADKWWDPWPGVAFMTPICITSLSLKPKMKDLYIHLYATQRSPSSDSDLITKLLAPEK